MMCKRLPEFVLVSLESSFEWNSLNCTSEYKTGHFRLCVSNFSDFKHMSLDYRKLYGVQKAKNQNKTTCRDENGNFIEYIEFQKLGKAGRNFTRLIHSKLLTILTDQPSFASEEQANTLCKFLENLLND